MADRLDQPAPGNVSNEVIAGFAIEADRAQRAIDEASGKKRAILKRAKAAGVDCDALLAALRAKKRDPDEVRIALRNALRYSGILAPGAKLTQDDLFGLDERPLNNKVRGEMGAWDADQAGYEAGKAGGQLDDSPYPAGSEAQAHYHTGWSRGQAVIAERMGEHARKADTGRTKRRGKAAAANDGGDEEDQTELEDAVAAGSA